MNPEHRVVSVKEVVGTVAATPSPTVQARSIPHSTSRLLAVRAGGRCEFRGCNEYLFEHDLTKHEANFAEQAHIVAFRAEGPRGADARPADVHDVNNLMLLCRPCHKLIDDRPADFTVSQLREYKTEHEERINRVTGLGPEMQTVVCALTAPIRGVPVDILRDDMIAAIAPMWPAESRFTEIDLRDLEGQVESTSFTEVCCARIDRDLNRLFGAGGPIARTPRLSVFALAPIPLLVYLGAKLENKVHLELFQRHRDTQDWRWKSERPRAAFDVRTLRETSEAKRIALVVSLSGTIEVQDLPEPARSQAQIYEIRLASDDPTPNCLRTVADLRSFGTAYQDFLGRLAADKGFVDEIDLFPAVPAPVAIMLGRDRLVKRHPALRVFDYDKANGGFTFKLRVD